MNKRDKIIRFPMERIARRTWRTPPPEPPVPTVVTVTVSPQMTLAVGRAA